MSVIIYNLTKIGDPIEPCHGVTRIHLMCTNSRICVIAGIMVYWYMSVFKALPVILTILGGCAAGGGLAPETAVREVCSDERLVAAAPGRYPVMIEILNPGRMAALGRRVGLPPDQLGGLTVWFERLSPRASTTRVYVREGTTYGVLAHELRHVFERDWHQGKKVYVN